MLALDYRQRQQSRAVVVNPVLPQDPRYPHYHPPQNHPVNTCTWEIKLTTRLSLFGKDNEEWRTQHNFFNQIKRRVIFLKLTTDTTNLRSVYSKKLPWTLKKPDQITKNCYRRNRQVVFQILFTLKSVLPPLWTKISEGGQLSIITVSLDQTQPWWVTS